MMIKRFKNRKKTTRIAFKRSSDFWTGFLSAITIVTILYTIFSNNDIEIKALLSTISIILIGLIYYTNSESKIIKVSLNPFKIWKKRNHIEDYSIGLDYKSLINMIENKKKIEEGLKMIKDLENDKKITDLIKMMNENNGNKIWKN